MIYFSISNDCIHAGPLNVMKGEYKSVSYNGESYLIHRLKGMTFLLKPEDYEYDQLVINHKDGFKFNNRWDNLEWTDYSGNLVHAFKNALRTDNKPCVVRDVITGIIHECYSISEAERITGTKHASIVKHLSKNEGSLMKFRYEVVESKDDLKFIEECDIYKYIKNACPMSVFDMDLKETVLLSGWSFFIKHSNSNYQVKPEMVPGKNYYFYNRYVVNILEKYTDIMLAMETCPYRKRNIKRNNSFNVQPLKVTVVSPDGTIKIYDSLKLAAKELNVNYPALQKRMSKYNGSWKGYQLNYIVP